MPLNKLQTLEIKDAQVIFRNVWESLVDDFGQDKLQFPKELILLGGAPGSGKGTQTKYILNLRGLTCSPIVVSSLLNSPKAEALKSAGKLVEDKDVVDLVFRELLVEEYRDGALLDGFPRTQVQVECLKLLVDKIQFLYGEYANTDKAILFRRPTIHAMVLFVSEQTSIDRQLSRGEEIIAENAKIEETGVGEKAEVRETDVSRVAAASRYRIFKEQTWDALKSLKEIYHYHFINAEGEISEVESNIQKELQYQSSLELDPLAYELLDPLPIAQTLSLHARQGLVKRLDCYAMYQRETFEKVLSIIQKSFMPIIARHAITGDSRIRTEDEIFNNPDALSMLIDIFSERGFSATVEKQIVAIPKSFDLSSGEITCENKNVYRIKVNFSGSAIRRG
ncbi:MAG: AAA family ATPase [Gammaproteobacteria bacterium]|nr:AAA family ATPase [Gammaproteobacteria bacterium]NKB62970.1 AAA family ATPase [Gammaproteobacteria bacterium]